MDIKPTLLSVLKINAETGDGRSLLGLITGQEKGRQSGDFFMETDLTPKTLRSLHPEAGDVLLEGAQYYRVNPLTQRVVVREEMLPLIISSKEYADVYQQWVLALYPQADHRLMPVLVNLKTGAWTHDLTSAFAKHSPAKHLFSALKKFYGADVVSLDS